MLSVTHPSVTHNILSVYLTPGLSQNWQKIFTACAVTHGQLHNKPCRNSTVFPSRPFLSPCYMLHAPEVYDSPQLLSLFYVEHQGVVPAYAWPPPHPDVEHHHHHQFHYCVKASSSPSSSPWQAWRKVEFNKSWLHTTPAMTTYAKAGARCSDRVINIQLESE